jgi:hypothetical protein
MVGVVVALLALSLAARPADQVGCRFVLGFASLRAALGPALVGECLEDERASPANGDALQRTTGGLLVWRKADNWTAFTDGHRTWVSGPNGIESRLNAEVFGWELPAAVAQAARAAAAPGLDVLPEAVAIERAEPVHWPDASLGCPEPGRVYAQVIVPGFRLVLGANGRRAVVPADERGRAVVCPRGPARSA